jgi:hypothetical protein
MLGGLAVILNVIVVILAVLGCGLFCWIIDNDARSDRVIRMLLTGRVMACAWGRAALLCRRRFPAESSGRAGGPAGAVQIVMIRAW